MDWHNKSTGDVANELNVSIATGLSEKEVAKRRHTYGLNQLEAKKNKSVFLKFLEQFKDFMIITLIFAAIVSFLVSYLNHEVDFVDPIIILLIITLNALLGVIQETKAERSLEALKKLSAPTALVKRDSLIKTVDATELVPGDIILLEAGHFVPADARLIEAINLKVEESSLTGESHPVEKLAQIRLPIGTLLADRRNLVMATCIVTYGRGTAIVTNTGMNTEVGHIAKLISEDSAPMTPLQKRLAGTSKVLGIIALVICAVIFLVGIIKQLPIFDMFMTSVSLAVAAIPEGLPAIVTIMLSLGVQRMAKKNAVIRKLPAVETLGSATVICSDKTGTLTQNKMTVTMIASSKQEEKKNTPFSNFLLTLASLCNDSVLQISKHDMIATGEPTEKAIVLAAHEMGINKSKNDLMFKRIHEIPFDSNRKLMTTFHMQDENTYRSITKGAPDVLINCCTHIYEDGNIVPLTPAKKEGIYKQNKRMAEQALRVIAVAYKDLPVSSAVIKNIKNYLPEKAENSLVFVGLIGMIDPPRDEVREAILTCKKAGIKPIMITGDHVITACAIGKSLGLLSSMDEALTGAELSQMSNEELSNNIYKYSVFARVSPEHKVRIVKAFQRNGEVVAMTGDGVNDAPALKAADIGCAMGIVGTDVAKNASDMILTDDNFATIVSAVREGRGIYDNIKKSVHFLLSSNIGEILTILVAILMGLPTPLLAVQLLWVNLVTDSLPAISLGVEPPEPNIMKKSPIPPNKGMFSDGFGFHIFIEGIMIGALALSAYFIGLNVYDGKEALINTNPVVGRTMAFCVLSLSQLFHAFNMRSDESIFKLGLFSNIQLLISFLICCFLQVIVVSVSSLATVFKVIPLTLTQWIIVFLLAFLPIVIIELQKKANKKL